MIWKMMLTLESSPKPYIICCTVSNNNRQVIKGKIYKSKTWLKPHSYWETSSKLLKKPLTRIKLQFTFCCTRTLARIKISERWSDENKVRFINRKWKIKLFVRKSDSLTIFLKNSSFALEWGFWWMGWTLFHFGGGPCWSFIHIICEFSIICWKYRVGLSWKKRVLGQETWQITYNRNFYEIGSKYRTAYDRNNLRSGYIGARIQFLLQQIQVMK